MRQRAIIHVAGPTGAGKTAFVEAVLGATEDFVIAARCMRDHSLRRWRETAPKTHPELRRYRRAGASGAAAFAFPERDAGSEALFLTDLMSDYSQAVILEGDSPLAFADLEVCVAPAPRSGERLFTRCRRNVAAEDRAKAAVMRRILRAPDGAAMILESTLGKHIVDFAKRRRPEVIEEARSALLAGLAAVRKMPPSKPVECWAVADRFAGIENAQLMVFNIRHDGEREAAERFVAELARVRKDEDLFKDVLGSRGSRIPITAVVANLADPQDAGRKKALARVRRSLRQPA